MQELRVDPEFRDKIPPLTDAEFEQLRENILSDGEVYEPIVVWNGTIVDGHNRWRIIQEHPEIPYRVKEMDFADKWAAVEWMCKKQLGRRNITDEQRTVLIGKMYEARKKTQGTNNQYVQAKNENRQNDAFHPSGKTSVQIAKELGVGQKTVERAEHFAKGIDAIEAVSPEAATAILKGNSGATKAEVAELRKAPQEKVRQFADDVVSGKLKSPRPQSKEMKEFNDKLNDVVEVMESDGKEYSLEDAVNDLNSAEDMFLMQIRFVLTEKTDVISTADGRTEFEHFIKSVIDDLNELKGELK